MRLYAGPKVLDVLASVRATVNGAQTGPNLEAVVNFGYAGIIAKPLFLALRWIHEHIVSNWGWAILVLTLVINLAMLPTRIQMMKSALKMQRIQPEMNAIKEKFKKYKATDPRRADMNKEMFDLQKREGVNMFGGCLPMLVQWPLLFAFYRMLLNTIELRQAPWLWLHNLAAPDPLHILPVFFIVTMFLVQYLTPSPGMDPVAAEDDGLYHARLFRLHDVESELGPGALLGLRQRDQCNPAGGDEPHRHWKADARDRRETRRQAQRRQTAKS